MKKIFTVLLTLLILIGCKSNKDEIVDIESDQHNVPTLDNSGGWVLNEDLPQINDAIFDSATRELIGASYSPICILGSQVVSGENIQYLCYASPISNETSISLKVITIYNNLNNESEVSSIADFNVKDYLDDEGENTPEGLMGGWSENVEVANLLSESDNEIFNIATTKILGVEYKPIALIASQVVAGRNLAILSIGTTQTEQPQSHLYVLKIYADLNGDATISNICGINLNDFVQK